MSLDSEPHKAQPHAGSGSLQPAQASRSACLLSTTDPAMWSPFPVWFVWKNAKAWGTCRTWGRVHSELSVEQEQDTEGDQCKLRPKLRPYCEGP